MEENNHTEGVEKKKEGKTSGPWRPIALLAAVISIIVLAKILKVDKQFSAMRDWIHSIGAWGPVVFVFLYAAGTVAALPGAALTIAAGALFGSVIGVITVSVASTLGASLAFLVGRYFARDAVAQWASRKEKFRQLDQLTEEHGAIIVAITRLVPIFPFNLLNYGFGLTRVRFRTYVLWSWPCMLPGTILYVVGADAFFKGLAEGRVPWVLIGVFAAMIVLIVILTRYARRKLHAKPPEAASKQAS